MFINTKPEDSEPMKELRRIEENGSCAVRVDQMAEWFANNKRIDNETDELLLPKTVKEWNTALL